MTLEEILGSFVEPSVASTEITSVEIDSRRCQPGTLFFALPGAQHDGAAFALDAVARGASVVVSLVPVSVDVANVVVTPDQLHSLVVAASAAITGHPENSVRLVGVTGTNGKTSVTTLLASMWRSMGRHADVVGTLTHERTTPASPELFRELARTRDSAIDGETPLLAIEVSSHALSQGRVDGVVFEVAAFTNLSLDHLDYHATMEEYFSAKARLFEDSRCRNAVIWVDDVYGERLANMVSVPVTAVARHDASDVELDIGHTSFTWRGQRVRTQLSGEFNLDNALIALSIATVLGDSPSAVAAAISESSTVPGRFEVISEAAPTVLVDFAHTPDGLERLLGDVRRLRPHARVTVVFGCGGDRDRSKRPLMGEIATRLADFAIVTSDNPRSEDPEKIIDEIVAGAKVGSSWQRIVDRRAAIEVAIGAAHGTDVVVIAGKGHETTQTVGDVVSPFDDRVVARELLAVGS
jgi:UDP-N-acetylmuramoyl-L-alanyl-D-glutamate--2,6-diaminopimelate ligase